MDINMLWLGALTSKWSDSVKDRPKPVWFSTLAQALLYIDFNHIIIEVVNMFSQR